MMDQELVLGVIMHLIGMLRNFKVVLTGEQASQGD